MKTDLPTPVFLPGESQGRGSLVAAVYGVAQSWTRLKRVEIYKDHLVMLCEFLKKGAVEHQAL